MKALITGITGQDGSYLAEFLLRKGYEVHGLIRRSSQFNTSRIDHLYKDSHVKGSRLKLHHADLNDASRIISLMQKIEPNEIYNLAAQSHVRVSFDEPEYTGLVTGLGTTKVLEALRISKVSAKFYQASSSEMFGATPPPQSENSEFYPRSPYGAAKVYAYWMTRNYREAYSLFAVNGILFNHESPRRGETFVTRKISRAVAQIKLGLEQKLYLGNLEARRDWGFAPEYVEAMWLMLQHEQPLDFVVATGTSYSVQQFLEAAFASVDLDWSEFVEFDPQYSRPTEVDSLIGNPTKAKSILGWESKVDPIQLAGLMVESDLRLLREPHLKVADANINYWKI